VTYRRVVVGTDGSSTASVAVDHAAALAAAAGSELLIVTAYQSHHGSEPADVPEELEWAVTDSAVAAEHMAQAVAIAVAHGVPAAGVHVISEPGDPADAIVGVAEARGADLIVVGSKGMSSATRFLLGSVPSKVAHHAPCDVLIVRTVR
jgi:nucleotide-binding universal stress UspA family protein